MQTDALQGALNTDKATARSPLSGAAAQGAGETPRSRVLIAMQYNCPQQALDEHNSLSSFRAKNKPHNAAQRRTLLAAVARLENERVDELTVLGTRYRVVRGEEYTGLGRDGIEQPRPTRARARRPQLEP